MDSLFRFARSCSTSLLFKYCKHQRQQLPRHLRCYSSQHSQSKILLSRSFMYVPGDSESKIQGLLKKCQPDIVVLDCEDGVSYNSKDKARETIRESLTAGVFKDFKRTVTVRINPRTSGFGEEDLRCVLESSRWPDALVLPKVESTEDFDWFSSLLSKHTSPMNDPIPLIFMIESAQALLRIESLVKHSFSYSNFQPEGIVFGSDDFCSSIGVERSRVGEETYFPRSYFALVARAHKLHAIDKVEIDYKDLSYLQAECQRGRRLGFTGKQVIHPGQLGPIHSEFSPSQLKLRWAKSLLAEFAKHNEEGTGAFVFEGQMVDMPTVRIAQNLLTIQSKIEAQDSS